MRRRLDVRYHREYRRNTPRTTPRAPEDAVGLNQSGRGPPERPLHARHRRGKGRTHSQRLYHVFHPSRAAGQGRIHADTPPHAEPFAPRSLTDASGHAPPPLYMGVRNSRAAHQPGKTPPAAGPDCPLGKIEVVGLVVVSAGGGSGRSTACPHASTPSTKPLYASNATVRGVAAAKGAAQPLRRFVVVGASGRVFRAAVFRETSLGRGRGGVGPAKDRTCGHARSSFISEHIIDTPSKPVAATTQLLDVAIICISVASPASAFPHRLLLISASRNAAISLFDKTNRAHRWRTRA
jgi:hypothetical protein